MYTDEAIESQRVRSVVGSVNGRSMQRRTGGNNSAATSRIFMNAVKDASKSRNPGDRTEENVSHRSDRGHSKRPYSPTMDYSKEDQKVKSRKLESESEYDRSFESDHNQDRYSRAGLERRSDQGLYMPSPPDYERRYGSNAASTNALPFPSDSNNNITLTPKAPRCRHWPNCDLGSACKFHHPTEICPNVPNCPNSPKTCLYIHPANQDFASYDQRSSMYRPNAFGNGTGQGVFGPRPSAFGLGSIGPMGHGIFGQDTSYRSGTLGTSVFVQNSHRTGIKSTAEQGSSVQKEEKHNINTTETTNTTVATTIQTTSSVTSNGTLTEHERDTSSQQAISSVPNAPLAVLCKFSENCANPNCMYAHASPASVGTGSIPSTLVDIPCKFGSECTQHKCRYSHPSPATAAVSQELCRYYPNCQNPMCQYLHVDYSNTMKVPTPCRNGAHCTRPGCHFMHPWETDTSSIPCKYGFNCRRPDCAYAHPTGKKNYSHISERTFAVPEEMTEKVLPLSENKEDKKEDEPVKPEEFKNELNDNKSENKEENKNKSGETEEEFNEEDFNWDLDFDVDVILNDEGMNGDIVTDL